MGQHSWVVQQTQEFVQLCTAEGIDAVLAAKASDQVAEHWMPLSMLTVA